MFACLHTLACCGRCKIYQARSRQSPRSARRDCTRATKRVSGSLGGAGDAARAHSLSRLTLSSRLITSHLISSFRLCCCEYIYRVLSKRGKQAYHSISSSLISPLSEARESRVISRYLWSTAVATRICSCGERCILGSLAGSLPRDSTVDLDAATAANWSATSHALVCSSSVLLLHLRRFLETWVVSNPMHQV